MVVNKSVHTHQKKNISYKHDKGLLALKSYIAYALTYLFSHALSKSIHTHANLLTQSHYRHIHSQNNAYI